ncbi:MAG TPA: hypothetical protein VHR66_13430 [Gemmataceae bacterium]|nr:hypothetical protein [Gemmataceae bacterium]
MPGTLLQLFGAVCIAWNVMTGALSLISPQSIINPYFDFIEDLQRNNPPDKQQKLPPRDEAIKSQQVQGPIGAVIFIIVGVVAFIGGSKMKSLSGYGWAMAGSIVTIFPGLCCCCFPLLPGIWSLVVLLNQDVKRSF